MKIERADQLSLFVQRREAIRLAKERGQEPPWTEDPILRMYRFCNVRRRHDRVSLWIQRYICEPYAKAAYVGPWLALARFVNWPVTLKELLDKGHTPEQALDWSAIGKVIDARTARGGKAWTGAYMIRAESPGGKGGKKGAYVCETVLRGMFDDEEKMSALGIALAEGRRQVVHTVLMTGHGWGSFMAGQVVDDWTWTRLLQNPRDEYTWAPQGPGSVRGLNRILGRPLEAKFNNDEEWCSHLVTLRSQVIEQLGPSFEDMTLMDIQNCCCELDKYLRVKNGEGRPRSIYSPEKAYSV